MDEIAARMMAVEWVYADKDPQTLAVFEERIADAGRKLGLITYSELVKGVDFHLPNIRKGEAYRIQIYDWTGLDRSIVGDFLGYLDSQLSRCRLHGEFFSRGRKRSRKVI